MRRVHLVAWRDREDPEGGGSEEHAAQLARHWAAAGLDVTLHTGRVSGLGDASERDGYSVRRGGGHLSVFPRTILWEWSGQAGPRDGLLDIFHGVPFSPLWARGPRVGFVHHVHLGTWRHRMPPGMAQVGYLQERVAVPLVYRRATLVTPSQATRQEIIEKLGMRHADIRIAPNGVDERFRPGGTRSSRPLVLAVGRLVPHKGFDVALRAIAGCRPSRPDLRCVVVGDGPALPGLRARFAKAHFLGARDHCDLPALYRAADVFVFPSRTDTFGLVLLEALACGTPVAALPGCASQDVLGNSGAGALDGDLARACRAALAIPRARAADYGRQFSWAACTRTFVDQLQASVAEGASGRS